MFRKMFRYHRYKSIYLLLIFAAVVLAGLTVYNPASAQTGNALERKADANLKRFFRLYRRQADTTPSPTRLRERAELRQQMAIEERAGVVITGVSLKLREASEAAQAEVEAAGFRVRARIGDIAVVTVATDDLPRLAEIQVVEAIYSSVYNYVDALSYDPIPPGNRVKMLRAANDAANLAVRAPDARATYGVTGRGVIVGVIDNGVDWKHGDFRRPDGTTRIKSMWDISDAAATGPGGLGRVYTQAEINTALQSGTGVDMRTPDSHGTHVTGIAAGNGLGAGTGGTPGVFMGIAPEADLVIVKANRAGSSGFRTDDLIAASAFIRDRAAEFNQPFVINMSIGGSGGYRDGSDPFDTAVDNLLAGGVGRHFAISAGNIGTTNNHAGGVIEQGKDLTLPFSVFSGAVGLQIIYPESDTVSARVVKPDGTIVGPVNFNEQLTTDTNVSLFSFASSTNNGARQIQIAFKSVISGTWQLILAGGNIKNGRYDVWSLDGGVTRLDPSIATSNYEIGSLKGTKRAFIVANYISKTQYVDVNGNTITRNAGPIGQGAISSSAGPTRDGRFKPNVAAPGTFLMSTLSVDTTPEPASTSTGPGGKHYAISGTSMASPVVAGTVALMLQVNPNLSPDQITRIIERTVINDSFTGPSVSYKYGYGKINALGAVKAVVDGVPASEFVSVSSASFAADLVAAPEAIVAGFGSNLAPATVSAASIPLPTELAGVSVRVTDSTGQARSAGLFFVSGGQINYTIPSGTAPGVALVDVLRGGNAVARGAVSINSVWPGLFSVNSFGNGPGAATVLRARTNGEQVFESANNPIDLSVPGDRVFLILFGTGIRGRSDLGKVQVTLGGTPLAVSFAGSQGGFIGLDQINVELTPGLAGRGQLDLLIYVDGWLANTVQFTIK